MIARQDAQTADLDYCLRLMAGIPTAENLRRIERRLTEIALFGDFPWPSIARSMEAIFSQQVDDRRTIRDIDDLDRRKERKHSIEKADLKSEVAFWKARSSGQDSVGGVTRQNGKGRQRKTVAFAL